MNFIVKPFDNQEHRINVISLWKDVFGYEDNHNEPGLVIDKKCDVDDGLFFVALEQDKILGTVMAGYDGHRGWIYSVAVAEEYRKKRLGSELISHAEDQLAARGCLKINLQIMEGNEAVEAFYLSNGYQTEKRISMGKKILRNLS